MIGANINPTAIQLSVEIHLTIGYPMDSDCQLKFRLERIACDSKLELSSEIESPVITELQTVANSDSVIVGLKLLDSIEVDSCKRQLALVTIIMI